MLQNKRHDLYLLTKFNFTSSFYVCFHFFSYIRNSKSGTSEFGSFCIVCETMESSQSVVALPSSEAVYGVKAIRQMKAATRVVGKPKPSERLVKKADNTYDYFLKEVDPLIGACITHMLCIQPSDVPLAMLDFFKQKKLEEVTVGETQVLAPLPSAVNSKAKKEQKIY